MAHNYPETIPAEYAEYESEYRRGWNNGHGIACHTVPTIGDDIERAVDWVGLGTKVTDENAAEYHELLCFTAEENSRCYSPWEFTAKEINDAAAEDESFNERWEAYDAGVADAIRADLAEYTAEDYQPN